MDPAGFAQLIRTLGDTRNQEYSRSRDRQIGFLESTSCSHYDPPAEAGVQEAGPFVLPFINRVTFADGSCEVTGGVVAAGNQVTADSAAGILRKGGNAVDAAVCGTFASCIAEIGLVHLGGSGVAQIYDPRGRESVVYNFFSRTPGLGRQSRPEHLDFYRTTIHFGPTSQDFFLGRGSVAVPGNVAGLYRLQTDFGRLSLQEVLDPVMLLAEEGVMLDTFQVDTCTLLKDIYTATPSIREVFMPAGRFVRAGQRLFVPDLSGTLQGIRDHGSRYLSDGPLGKALVDDQDRRGGLLTLTDLQEFEPERKSPIRVPYRGYEVLLPPPCSTGGALTAFSLKLLSEFEPGKMEWGSAAHLRLLAEIMAATSRARSHWDRLVNESSPTDAVEEFLGSEHLESALQPVTAAFSRQIPGSWAPEPRSPASTTHLSVIDKEGMAVSLTHSAGESAGFVVPGTGFIPNNMMGEADLHPEGFHSSPPGHSIATMMTPLIMLKDNRVRAVLGSGGSTRIRTVILQLISNLVDFGFSLERAVKRPRVHYEDGILQCEQGYSDDVRSVLEKIGYQVRFWDCRSIYFGGAHCVGMGPAGSTGAADPRRGGATSRG